MSNRVTLLLFIVVARWVGLVTGVRRCTTHRARLGVRARRTVLKSTCCSRSLLVQRPRTEAPHIGIGLGWGRHVGHGSDDAGKVLCLGLLCVSVVCFFVLLVFVALWVCCALGLVCVFLPPCFVSRRRSRAAFGRASSGGVFPIEPHCPFLTTQLCGTGVYPCVVLFVEQPLVSFNRTQ